MFFGFRTLTLPPTLLSLIPPNCVGSISLSGLVRLFHENKHLGCKLMTWFQAIERWWKESTDSINLSSDLHRYSMTCIHTYPHTKSISTLMSFQMTVSWKSFVNTQPDLHFCFFFY